MEQAKSLRTFVKSIPIVGPTARFANRSRIFVKDMLYADRRRNALLRLKHGAAWYVLQNPQRQKEFARERPTVTPAQQELIEALRTQGVAARSFDQAGIEPGEWRRLQEKVGEFARFSAERITAAAASYSDKLDLGSLEHNRERFRRFFRDKSEAKLDDYILKMNPENSVLPSDHPLLTIALSPGVLHVVASYMGLWPKLIYADAWYSIPMDPGKRIGSQQWHRDPEDKQMVKVYLHFSEIDASAGAMEYILGTSNTQGGRGIEIGQWRAAGANLYPSTEMVEQTFPSAQRFSCAGPVGTLLFCDTTGLHRGGISKAKPRVVATWTFVTPASRYIHRFNLTPDERRKLSREAQFAVAS